MSQEISKITHHHIVEITKQEAQLLFLLRNRFRYGQVIIEMRGGVPYRILKAFESEDIV